MVLISECFNKSKYYCCTICWYSEPAHVYIDVTIDDASTGIIQDAGYYCRTAATAVAAAVELVHRVRLKAQTMMRSECVVAIREAEGR